MRKSLWFILLVSLLIAPSITFAVESITITTYYPSPYGSYRELRSKRLAIGDNYTDTASYTWEEVNNDGGQVDYLADLVVEGNVGIGTTSPNTLLHLNSASNVGPQITLSASSGGTPGIIFRPWQTASQWSNPAQASITATDSAYSADIHFSTKALGALGNALVERMTILGGGNVGIGTATPWNKFEVMGAAHFDSNGFWPGISNKGTYFAYNLSGQGETCFINNPVGGVGGFRFLNLFNGGANYGDSLTIFNNGNVGIGTTTPLNKFEVMGAAHFDSNGFWPGISNKGTYLAWNLGATGETCFINNPVGSSGGFRFLNLFNGGANYGDSLIISNNGNVGIGITPTRQLQLSRDDAYKPGTTLWGVISDKRIKKNITDFTDGLNVVMKLRPHFYQYNGLGGKGYDDNDTHIGFVAQELELVAPYMVLTGEGKIGSELVKDFKSYQGHALAFVLVNAIQEQQKEIEVLKSEIQKMKDSGLSHAK